LEHRGASIHFDVVCEPGTVIVDVEDFQGANSRIERRKDTGKHAAERVNRSGADEVAVGQEHFAFVIRISDVAAVTFRPLGKRRG
jgi:hypothetical protein